MAQQHVITKSFNLQGKPCSLSYFMVSCHKYEGKQANGAPEYNKYRAGTRVKVNDESWYVGQGQVCLNYVDYYKMKNYIPLPDNSKTLSAELVYADPQAINNVTSYTVSESVEVSGTVGFEAGGSQSQPEAKGIGSFSTGTHFPLCIFTPQFMGMEIWYG